jgi:DNA-binding NtrC family response regulator
MQEHESTVAVEVPSQPEGGMRSDAAEDFERFLRRANHTPAADPKAPLSLREWVDLAEAWRITQALRECKGNRSAAARALGIGRRTLYAKMEKLGITPSFRAASLD